MTRSVGVLVFLVAMVGAASIGCEGFGFTSPPNCRCPPPGPFVIVPGRYDFTDTPAIIRTEGSAEIDDETVVLEYRTGDGSRWRVTYDVVDVELRF